MEQEIIVTVYFAAVFLPALFGTILGVFPKSPKVSKFVSALCIVSCAVGVTTYPLWHYGYELLYAVPIHSAIGEYVLNIDQLTAAVISMSSVIYILVVVHEMRSTTGSDSRYGGFLNILFLACFTCMAADSVIALLLSWETVTLSTFMMAKRGNNEKARWLFFVIAHIGGMLLLTSFVYMSSVAGTQILSEWDNLSAIMGSGVSMTLIMMLILGFGAKLGLIPFHAWMPGMYASAPIHTTALLSTVCSNVAVLVLIKGIFSYIGVMPSMSWIAFVIMAIAAITALWGALESLIQDEPKKILAYSSMENMALVVLCLALGMIYVNESPAFGKLVLIAAMLHSLNHSVFKSLMLLTIDTVEDCTKEKKIWRMGGLSKALPALSVVAIIGVLSMAAIPPTNGFVSEWLMIQSLMGGDLESKGMSLLIPLALAAVGICGMMMAASYARLYAFVFLGRPRSEKMVDPEPMKGGTIVPMVILAAFCLLMGFFATVIMDVLGSGIVSLTGMPSEPHHRDVMTVELLPLILGTAIVAVLGVIFWLTYRRKRNVRKTRTWGCGGELDETMQYSSIGFSQPLVKVFHPLYGDAVMTVESDEKGERSVFAEMKEPFVKYIYKPLADAVTAFSERVGRMQSGSIQSYFAYILITLVAVLLATRFL